MGKGLAIKEKITLKQIFFQGGRVEALMALIIIKCFVVETLSTNVDATSQSIITDNALQQTGRSWVGKNLAYKYLQLLYREIWETLLSEANWTRNII